MSEDEGNGPPSPKRSRSDETGKKGKSRAPATTEQTDLRALIKEVLVDVLKEKGEDIQTAKESQGPSPTGSGERLIAAL